MRDKTKMPEDKIYLYMSMSKILQLTSKHYYKSITYNHHTHEL